MKTRNENSVWQTLCVLAGVVSLVMGVCGAWWHLFTAVMCFSIAYSFYAEDEKEKQITGKD